MHAASAGRSSDHGWGKRTMNHQKVILAIAAVVAAGAKLGAAGGVYGGTDRGGGGGGGGGGGREGPRTAGGVKGLLAKRFPGPVCPAVSFVTTRLAHPRAMVALDAVASVPGDGPAEVVRRRCEALPGEPGGADVAILPRGEAGCVG